MTDAEMGQFVLDRNDALLSLDRKRIEEFAKKYGTDWTPSSNEVFWRAVHKARTAIMGLPQEARDLSERWLKERGSESWVDKLKETA